MPVSTDDAQCWSDSTEPPSISTLRRRAGQPICTRRRARCSRTLSFSTRPNHPHAEHRCIHSLPKLIATLTLLEQSILFDGRPHWSDTYRVVSLESRLGTPDARIKFGIMAGASSAERQQAAKELRDIISAMADLRGEATYLLSLCPSRSNGYLLP